MKIYPRLKKEHQRADASRTSSPALRLRCGMGKAERKKVIIDTDPGIGNQSPNLQSKQGSFILSSSTLASI